MVVTGIKFMLNNLVIQKENPLSSFTEDQEEELGLNNDVFLTRIIIA
jgi:hypothetical protein